MFYVQRGEVPHKRHTQFRKADGALYAEELFGVEGFSGRASLLYHHTPPTQTHQIEKVRDVRLEQSPDEAGGAASASAGQHEGPAGQPVTGSPAASRSSTTRDVTFGVVLPAEPMERFYRNGEADEMYFVHTGTRRAGDELRTDRVRAGRLPRHPHRHDLPRCDRHRDDQRMLWVESPSSIVPPKRYRNDFGQLLEHSPYCERDIRPPAEMAPHPRGRRLRHRGQDPRPDHRLPLPAPSVRPRRLGRAPVAVRVQHRRLRADHRARPPAAAGPPHLPAAQLRDLLVRAAQVRLPPARHPGAVQPLEHQLRRGHLLRRRQLHEPPRRGHLLVHRPPGRASRTGRIRGRSRRRSARRRPRSWR